MTAFILLGTGPFKWVMSPMGLLECPTSFQRLVEMAINGLINVIEYIDGISLIQDIILGTDSKREISIRLRNAELEVNLAKCEFRATNVSCLG